MNCVKEKVTCPLLEYRRSDGKGEDIKLLHTYSSVLGVGETDVLPYRLVTTSL